PIFIADLRPEPERLHLERSPESVFLFTADDLRAICQDNLAANRKNALKLENLLREQAAAVLEWRQKHTPSRIEGIIGRSASLQRILDVLPRIAATDITVLLEGESGTGKEVIARAIHRLSKRAHSPFVVVNAGAIPETLLESELFGHVRGAFTGAHAEKKGLFEEATGGTLFLDEIGEMSPALQVKLLRALQEREIRRVGGNRVRKIDVRLIAATNRDLQRLVREGRFRQDLYYRLNVMRLRIPPLRERPEDIPVLADHFLRKANQKLGKHVREISPQAMALLLRYRWPGNVRELENAIEHAVVLAVGHSILPEDLPQEIRTSATPAETTAAPEHWPTLEEVERQHIVQTLEAFGWNLALVTKKLGISRATLWRKMKAYGLQPPVSNSRGNGGPGQ
ncbi:MAG: sigma-54-dependent Fis family transcriptional regulator, partial [Calditrichaeota bacterium]|nr:sigma-54-dependent Fis family transcriptional regulator [Calditrichota bacterium]